MRAVNLIPAEERVSGRGLGVKLSAPTMGLFAVLAAAIVLVTLYVLAGNTVASRQAELTTARAELTRAQTEAQQLQPYTQFATLALTRVQTVRSVAGTRFDWNSALENLARVIPADTSLQSLSGTVVPGAAVGGASGSASSLRADLLGPAFEINGCTGSQDEVAALISRLRTLPDVERVALGSSQKTGTGASGGSSSGSQGAGCSSDAPSFSLIVFYKPVAGAGAQGATTAAAAGATGATTGTAPTTTTTPAGGSK